MKEYPLFLIPDHLASRKHKEWTAKEAKEYKEYLLSIMDERTEYLIKHLGLSEDKGCEVMLLEMGEKAAPILKTSEFSEDSQIIDIMDLKGHTYERKRGMILKDMGLSFAADMGLLVAKCLLKELGNKIFWDIVKRPKLDMSYNKPVLRGFKVTYLEPIQASIAGASAVLRGDKGTDFWEKLFDECMSDVK